MTKDELRKIDAEIATKIMDTLKLEGTFVQKVDQENGIVSVGTEWHYPPYSTDIKAAWDVVENLKGTGFYFTLRHYQLSAEGWEAVFETQDNSFKEVGTTAPLAICKAALRVLRISED